MSIEELGAELGITLGTHDGFKSQVQDLARAEVQRLEREEGTLNSMLQNVKAELRAARSVLGVIVPPEPKPKKKPSSGLSTATMKNLSPHRREELMAWITGREDEFCVADVQAGLRWAESQAATGMVVFRHEGHIRLSRMGGRTGSTKYYRSMV